MSLTDKRIGFAMCGSFCTFSRATAALEKLAETGAAIIPIMSETAYNTDTRFGDAEFFRHRVEKITGSGIINTVKGAEPIGPKALLDLLVILPCTGNTLAKISNGIADTSVTMAAKSHLRNRRPVLIAVSTNDGLGSAAKNIGNLMNYKGIYFLPFSQDDCEKKPNSLVSDFSRLNEACEAALEYRQLQPVLC